VKLSIRGVIGYMDQVEVRTGIDFGTEDAVASRLPVASVIGGGPDLESK